MKTQKSSIALFDEAYALFRNKTGLSSMIDFARHLELVTGNRYTPQYLSQMNNQYVPISQKARHLLISYLLQPNEIGPRIRWYRKEQGLTYKELSARSKVSIGYLSDIESGRTEPPLRTLRKIADGLGISLQAILDGIE